MSKYIFNVFSVNISVPKGQEPLLQSDLNSSSQAEIGGAPCRTPLQYLSMEVQILCICLKY